MISGPAVERAFHKVNTLASRKSVRIGALLISSLAFLLVIGAYYVTAYLKFRSTVYDADALYFPMLYDDLVHGVGLAGWSTSTVPYIFPDALLLFLLRTLLSNVHIALAVYGLVQILLFTVGLLLLAKQLFESFRLEHYILILCAGSLFFAGLAYWATLVQLFAVSTYHFGVSAVMPYVFALALAFVKSSPTRRKRPWFTGIALLVLLALILLSDLFAVIQICAPLVAALLALWLLQKVRLKQVLLVVGLMAAAACLSYLFIQTIPQFRASFNTNVGSAAYTFRQSLSVLLAVTQNLLERYPLQMILLSLCVVLCVLIVGLEAVSFIRYKRTKHNDIVFFAVAFLTILLLNPVTVTITGLFKTEATLRYLLPLLVLPAFWCWPLLLEFFVRPSTLRVLAMVGLLSLVLLGVGSSWVIAGQVSKVHLDDYYPDQVRCIDEVARQQGVTHGLAGYWQAKPLTALSKRNLKVVQVNENLSPFIWLNNSSWYDLEPEFIVIDNHNNDVDQKNLEERFGPPASIAQCQQLAVWIYNRPADKLFRQQLKMSPFLAQLKETGDAVEFYAALLPSQVGEKLGLSRRVEGTTPGFLTYGPYIKLPAGYYRFEITYQIGDAQDQVAHWDVVSNKQIIKSGLLPSAKKVDQHTFHLSEPGQVEIRTFYEGKGDLTVEKIRLSKIEP